MSFLIGSFGTYGGQADPGCNLYDALLYGARCQGFFGATVVSGLANFALLVGQLVAMSITSLMAAPFGLLLLAPVVFSLYLGFRQVRQASKSRRDQGL